MNDLDIVLEGPERLRDLVESLGWRRDRVDALIRISSMRADLRIEWGKERFAITSEECKIGAAGWMSEYARDKFLISGGGRL